MRGLYTKFFTEIFERRQFIHEVGAAFHDTVIRRVFDHFPRRILFAILAVLGQVVRVDQPALAENLLQTFWLPRPPFLDVIIW